MKDSLWILELAYHLFSSLGIEIDLLSDEAHLPIIIKTFTISTPELLLPTVSYNVRACAV